MLTSAATIMIVDDELASRDALEHLLLAEGYHTITIANGKIALKAVLESAPDLILLDITMPDMDGFEVAQILKSYPATSSIPIIMVTANTGHAARVVGLDTGAQDYLTKPVDATELLLKVRNLLRLKSKVKHAQPH